jgi:hexulose-6-phosphate isomerase
VFEDEGYEHNPLWTDEGVDCINQMIQEHGIAVTSVCADYFMDHPFFRVSSEERARSVTVLKRLIEQVARISAKVILMPVLEVAEIRSETEANHLVSALQACLPVARIHGVHLGLETELPADRYKALIARFTDLHVGIYYDMGNASARGYDLAEDIRILGERICGTHIKDRKRDGPSVLLGQGNIDFTRCFGALMQVGYQGPLILQTAFGKDYMETAAAHRQFIKDCWCTAEDTLPERKKIKC